MSSNLNFVMKKPLNQKSYDSIHHLPGSRRGPADKGLTPQQAKILTESPRKGDFIFVHEKLDGSNVAIAKVNDTIVPLTRAGYRAETSSYEQHRSFADFVMTNYLKWYDILHEGERLCGEWMHVAHGTRYNLDNPFFVFDLMRGTKRALQYELVERLDGKVPIAPLLTATDKGVTIEDAMTLLGTYGLTGAALDSVEGAVWRVERNGRVDFLGKYVRPEFEPGKYLFLNKPIYNW